MEMIRHYHESVQNVFAPVTVMRQYVHHQLCPLLTAEQGSALPCHGSDEESSLERHADMLRLRI